MLETSQKIDDNEFGYNERESVTWKIPVLAYSDLQECLQDYFGQIYRSEIDGIIIKNVVDAAQINKGLLIPELERNLMVEETDFGKVVGRTLDGASDNAMDSTYFPETKLMESHLNQLFQTDFTDTISKIIGNVAGGINGKLPELSGKPYKPATVRMINPNQVGMREHIGNEFLKFLPQEEHISAIADPRVRFSYFIQLAKPESGGKLSLFDLVWKNTPEDLMINQGVVHKMKERTAFLKGLKKVEMPIEAGDMIIFDGGRIWHEVTPVEGNQSRVTVGGFAAYSNNHDQIYFWS